MSFDLNPEQVTHNPFFVGAAGSIVALKSAPGNSWFERAFNVMCGSLSAGFCAPALLEWLQVTSTGMLSFASFAVGLFGLSLAAAITQGLKDIHVAEIISGYFSRKG